MIGIPRKGNVAWDSLRTTKNIVIDGSNTVGGTTRDLTIQTLQLHKEMDFHLQLLVMFLIWLLKNTNIYYKAQGSKYFR